MGIHQETVVDLDQHRLHIKEGNFLTSGKIDGIEISRGLQPVIILYTTESGALIVRVRDENGLISQSVIAH